MVERAVGNHWHGWTLLENDEAGGMVTITP
jgi:hypothetical protein